MDCGQKLEQTCSSRIRLYNDWFILCSEVYAELGETIIFPTMELLELTRKYQTKLEDY
jgi:hypothetical protein